MSHPFFRQAYAGLDDGLFLAVCAEGDWWQFTFHLDSRDGCPTHPGRCYRAIPGRDVTGPCPTCGTAMALESYNPDRRTAEDLRCPTCRGAS